jgi:RNA polymerase sigma factor (sigma-70 family)
LLSLAIKYASDGKRNAGGKPWTATHFEAVPIDPLAGEIADLVASAVQALPPLQREALVLFEYEGLSLEQIARAADADVGAIKSRLSRARENLRECWRL